MATLLTQRQQQSNGAVQFITQGAQVSQALQQSQGCSQANLVSDALGQAQQLAAAAGFTVGPVIAISDRSVSQLAPSVIRGGSFATFLTLGAYVWYAAVPVTPPSICTTVLKFRLYRYH